jgi:hypothetical protein
LRNKNAYLDSLLLLYGDASRGRSFGSFISVSSSYIEKLLGHLNSPNKSRSLFQIKHTSIRIVLVQFFSVGVSDGAEKWTIFSCSGIYIFTKPKITHPYFVSIFSKLIVAAQVDTLYMSSCRTQSVWKCRGQCMVCRTSMETMPLRGWRVEEISTVGLNAQINKSWLERHYLTR